MAWDTGNYPAGFTGGEIQHGGDQKGFHIIYGWFWKVREMRKEEGFKALGMYWDGFVRGKAAALVIEGKTANIILDAYKDRNADAYFERKM